MVSKGILKQLQREKIRLLRIEKKQIMSDRLRAEAKSEERQLRRDIINLKRKTSKSLIRKISRRAKKFAGDPQTKRAIQEGKKKVNSLVRGFNKFIAEADRRLNK